MIDLIIKDLATQSKDLIKILEAWELGKYSEERKIRCKRLSDIVKCISVLSKKTYYELDSSNEGLLIINKWIESLSNSGLNNEIDNILRILKKPSLAQSQQLTLF